MIYEAHTRKITRYFPILFVVTLGIFLRLYKIKEAFPFDHDQETAANAAFNFLQGGKLSLIGQELSFPGFFLGPIHNWINIIPYALCNRQPDCVPYFTTTIGVLTTISIFLVVDNIVTRNAAFVASLIFAASFAAIGFERGVNSNYFLPLSSLVLFFCLYKYFKGKSSYLAIGALIAGLATVNFNPVFIFSSVAFFLTSLARAKKEFKIYIISIIAFLINYLPLLIFNIRHESILSQSLFSFISQNAQETEFWQKIIYLIRAVIFPFWASFLFQSANPLLLIVLLIITLLGFYYLLKNSEKVLLFLPVCILTALFGFLFYKGHIPDYYFIQTLLPFAILTSIVVTKNRILTLIFLSIFLFMNLKAAQNYNTIINYQFKKQAVDYIVNDSQEKSFNVYYDFPIGLNTGYSYLFKAKGRQPQEGGDNLYIIDFKDPADFNLNKYETTFSDKKVKVKSLGYLHIVSVTLLQ